MGVAADRDGRRERRSYRRVVDRRRRRVHRQPLRPNAARTATTSSSVTVYDNFSSGRRLAPRAGRRRSAPRDRRGRRQRPRRARPTRCAGATTVVHLASNPDIARAMTDPTIDFDEGTLAHAPRRRGRAPCRRRAVLYASGSGVYGDLGELEADEDHGPLVPDLDLRREQARRRGADLRPTATCSASAVARSASATSSGRARRTASASTSCASCSPTRPGSRSSATARRASPTSTSTTSSPRCCSPAQTGDEPFAVFNVATGDYITVTEIADARDRVPRPRPGGGRARATRGGDRGWKGDVPIVRLATDRIRALGWQNRYSSGPALRASIAGDARRRPRRTAVVSAGSASRLPRPRRRAEPGRSSATAGRIPPGGADDVVRAPRCRRGVPPARRRRAGCSSS